MTLFGLRWGYWRRLIRSRSPAILRLCRKAAVRDASVTIRHQVGHGPTVPPQNLIIQKPLENSLATNSEGRQ